MLNRQWLRSFATLTKLGSFTKSADQLGLTQAAISQHIRHLEEKLGPLLVRHPRRIELTPAGRTLLEYCRELDAADQRLQVRLADGDAAHGPVGLITPGSVGLSLYPILLDLQAEHRGLAIRHRFAPDHEVREAVLDNRFDLGLVTLKPEDRRLTARAFTEEALELVVPAGESVTDWPDLERLGFVDHPDGQAMATRLLSRRFPDNPGVRNLPCSGFTNQVGLILEPVARGFGFTVIPRYAREAFEPQAAIQVIDCERPIIDTLWLIHRAEWPLSSRARRVVDYLHEHIAREKALL